jgi:hypothetical protein
MKPLFIGLSLAAGLLMAPVSARADSLLSLSSPNPDRLSLSVGETLVVNVDLSGLSTEQIGYLAATVDFDGSLLSTPTTINPGAIITDSRGFVGTPLPGAADAFYDFLFTGVPITSDATFFTFLRHGVGCRLGRAQL